MNPKVNNYISPSLVEDIKSHLQAEGEDFVPSEYKGYISALGAAIRQSGVVPALAFYHDDQADDENGTRKKGSEQKRQPLVMVLENAIKGKFAELATTSLFEYALSIKNDKAKLRKLEKELTYASIALKLTLRTFHLKKDKQ